MLTFPKLPPALEKVRLWQSWSQNCSPESPSAYEWQVSLLLLQSCQFSLEGADYLGR